MPALKGKLVRQAPNKHRKVYPLAAVAVSTDYEIVKDMGVPANTLTLTFNQNATVYIHDGSDWSEGIPHYAGIQTKFIDEEIFQFRIVPGVAGNGTILCSGW